MSFPGALSKQVMNATLPYVITDDDCGATKGIALDVMDSDVVDRFLVRPVKIGGTTMPAGTLSLGQYVPKYIQSAGSGLVKVGAAVTQALFDLTIGLVTLFFIYQVF